MAGAALLRRALGAGDGAAGRRRGSAGGSRRPIRSRLLGTRPGLSARCPRGDALRLHHRPDGDRTGPPDLTPWLEGPAGRPGRRGLCRRRPGILQPPRPPPSGRCGAAGRVVPCPPVRAWPTGRSTQDRMTGQEAQAYCPALAKRSGSNFYYSFFFLPPDRRDAMHAVYAFCREVDSVVDEPESGSNPHDRLARWREELASLYRTERSTVAPPVEALSPVMTCLGGHIRRLGIPREYFDDIIAGVAMDLTIKRYATFRDLYQYCYRVASAVGLVCLKIFGARAPEAQTYAINLGIAFQLTNILRDLKTDGARARIYLPMVDLTRVGHSEQDLLGGACTPAFG